MSYINTNSGQIEIIESSVSLLKEIQTMLPYGFFSFNEPVNGYKYGFVIKCGSEELKCLKQQPVEASEEVAHRLIHVHHLFILDTYVQIKDKIGDSIYYATPYLKNKGESGFESGIAHFFYPKGIKHQMGNSAYETPFGEGATDLLMTFAQTYQQVNKSSGLNLHYIGLDLRTRAQLGALISGFMIYKGNFIYHGAQAQEGDPRFELLAKRGVRQVIHLPSAPMEITPEQLAEAKGL